MKRTLSLLLVAAQLSSSAPAFADDWDDAQPRAEEWFFRDLPKHIAGDLKETFWNGWHLLLLTGGGLLTVGIHEKDRDIREAFQPERPFGDTFDDAMNWGFHPFVLGGASLITLGVAKFHHAEKVALTAGTMLEALILTETITVGLQFATRRGRPDASNNRSFPSAHTSGAFALASVAQIYYGPWIGVPSYVVASLVGASRIDANKHAASDVIAGALLGTLIGLGTAKWHKKEFSRFFLVPAAGDGSPGVSMVYRF